MPANRVQGLVVVTQELAPVGHEFTNGTSLDQPVGLAGHVVAGARPRVVCGLSDHVGSDWVALDVADDGQQVAILLDGKGVKPLLEEVPPHPLPKVDGAGVAPVGLAHGVGQRSLLVRDEDEVDVVRHETPRPDLHVVLGGELDEQLQIGLAIRVRREEGH
jgi:hypothetical protein